MAGRKKKWNDDVIIEELKSLISILGHFPTNKYLNDNYSGLSGAIYRYGGSLKFKRILGCKTKKFNGYWKDIKNICQDIEICFPDLISKGIFPNTQMLRHNGFGTLFGKFGLKKVAKEMNCKICEHWKSRDGHFLRSYYEFLLDEFLYSSGIEHEPDCRIHINYPYLCDQKLNNYFVEIWGFPKNNRSIRGKNYNNKRKIKESLYKKLKLNLISIECKDMSKPIDQVYAYLIDIFESRGFVIEKKINFTDLIYSCEGTSKKIWTYSKTLEEFKKFVEINGTYPRQSDISSCFNMAIFKNGGVRHFTEILNIEHEKKPDGYWTIEKILEELLKITQSIGYIPGSKTLYKLKKCNLSRAISRNGGFIKIKEIFKERNPSFETYRKNLRQ